MPPPLHERVKRLLPQKVLDRIPEKLKPPAWREPVFDPATTRTQTLEEWPQREVGELRFVWGDPAFIWSREPDRGVTVTENSKGKPIDPVRLPHGTKGRMVAVGPDFVVLEVGEGYDARRYRVPKHSVFNTKPEHERKLGRGRGRGRILEITAHDVS